MDLRKINSYMILLAIVVVVGLFVSTVARLVIFEYIAKRIPLIALK